LSGEFGFSVWPGVERQNCDLHGLDCTGWFGRGWGMVVKGAIAFHGDFTVNV
jgi:hypothetical protein